MCEEDRGGRARFHHDPFETELQLWASLHPSRSTRARFAVGGRAIVTTLPKRMHTTDMGRGDSREKEEGTGGDGYGALLASNARP